MYAKVRYREFDIYQSQNFGLLYQFLYKQNDNQKFIRNLRRIQLQSQNRSKRTKKYIKEDRINQNM